MGQITEDADEIYRDLEVPGAPVLGEHEPDKGQIRQLFADIDTAIETVATDLANAEVAGRKAYLTWAALSAVTLAANTIAEVPPSDTGTHTDPIAGGTVDNSGVYMQVIGPPTTGWRRIGNYAVTQTASQAEVNAGTNNTKAVTPQTLANRVDARKQTVWLEYVSGLNNAQVLKVSDPYTTLTGDLTQYRFRTEARVESGFGNVAYRILQNDGVTEALPSTSLFNDANVIGTGEIKVGDVVDFARNTGSPLPGQGLPSALRMLTPPDLLASRVAKTIVHAGQFGKIPNVVRPVGFVREDRNTDFIQVRPHPTHYTGSMAGSKRGSDRAVIAQFNMRDFQNDPGGAPCMNSYFGFWGSRPVHDCNLLFTALDSGVTTDVGQVPSTVEPPTFVLNYTTESASQAAISGIGHGYQADNAWTMTRTLNDPSTGTILSATKANPLVIRLNINPYVVGDKFTPRGVTGMTELNGQELTVTAVSTTVSPNDTVTIGAVNSTGYGTFTGHTGGIDRTFADFHSAEVNTEYFADKIQTTFTGLNTNVGGSPIARFTYQTTYESVAEHTIHLLSTFDFTDPAVLVTPGFVRAFALVMIGTDFNRCRPIINGVPGSIFTIDTRDDTSTLLGYPEAILLWHSDFPEHQVKVENLAGYGYTHWQDSGAGWVKQAGGPGLTSQTYIQNFDWGIKVYGCAFGSITGLDKYDMTGKKQKTEQAFTFLMADPQV